MYTYILRCALFNEVLWISAVPLFHLGSGAVCCLLGKIKFTLTFPPIFILLMCVSTRGSLCVGAVRATASVHDSRFSDGSAHILRNAWNQPYGPARSDFSSVVSLRFYAVCFLFAVKKKKKVNLGSLEAQWCSPYDW